MDDLLIAGWLTLRKNAREIEIDLLQILVQLLHILFEIRFSTTSQRALVPNPKTTHKQTTSMNPA